MSVQIQAIIFDLDDTLVKTQAIKWAQHKAVAKQHYNVDLSDEVLKEHWGKPFDVLITKLHNNADTIENMRAAYESSAHLFPKQLQEHTLRVVEELLARELQLGILTASNKDFVIRDLTRLGFPLERFFSIQAADETLVHKPDPGVFIPTLEKLQALGIGKEAAMYVGDAVGDYLAARDAGLEFVAVTSGIDTEEQFRKCGVTMIIKSLDELTSLIR